MENFPAEVLEIVFHPLSKQEDIQKCYETNSKWRHIIENMAAKKSILDSFIRCIIPIIYFYFMTMFFLHTLTLGLQNSNEQRVRLPPSLKILQEFLGR